MRSRLARSSAAAAAAARRGGAGPATASCVAADVAVAGAVGRHERRRPMGAPARTSSRSGRLRWVTSIDGSSARSRPVRGPLFDPFGRPPRFFGGQQAAWLAAAPPVMVVGVVKAVGVVTAVAIRRRSPSYPHAPVDCSLCRRTLHTRRTHPERPSRDVRRCPAHDPRASVSAAASSARRPPHRSGRAQPC